MNGKLIEQVIDAEKRAEALLASVTRDSESLPSEAEAAARELVTRARADAQVEAQKIVEAARADNQARDIVAKAQEKIRQTEALGLKNLERAVVYVLDRVMGRD